MLVQILQIKELKLGVDVIKERKTVFDILKADSPNVSALFF